MCGFQEWIGELCEGELRYVYMSVYIGCYNFVTDIMCLNSFMLFFSTFSQGWDISFVWNIVEAVNYLLYLQIYRYMIKVYAIFW